jgi:hypothetical protein
VCCAQRIAYGIWHETPLRTRPTHKATAWRAADATASKVERVIPWRAVAGAKVAKVLAIVLRTRRFTRVRRLRLFGHRPAGAGRSAFVTF